MSNDTTYPLNRICPSCKKSFSLTAEYWHRDKSRKDGFVSYCKKCVKKRHQKYDKAKAAREWNRNHPEIVKKRVAQWEKNNPDKVKKRSAKKYQAIRSNPKKWREYLDKGNARHRQRNKDKPELKRAANARRRGRKNGLPCTFTSTDEKRALDYFNGRCAICERPLRDLFGERTVSMDHWIALSDPRLDNPGTVPENMVPVCFGIDGCNSKKGARDPEEWLIADFGKKKAQAILKRVQTFFSQVREADTLTGNHDSGGENGT